MNYPLIAVVGASGTGKSYSLRNLNPQTTRILNIERKPLPFRKSAEYSKQNLKEHSSVQTFEADFDVALAAKDIDTIVIESFSKYAEMLLTMAKSVEKGYSIYNLYNDKVTMFLEKAKSNNNKFVVILGIDEIVKFETTSGGETATRRLKVAGKQWEGMIEKEFTIVLFTFVKPDADKTKPPKYQFVTNNYDGTISAKSPPDMFGGLFIDNDIARVVEVVRDYYKLGVPQPESILLK